MTGFNMPPGVSVSDIPGCGYGDDFCEVCCFTLDNCICPECTICQVQGNPTCYTKHGMVHTEAQLASRTRYDEAIKSEEEREAKLWSTKED